MSVIRKSIVVALGAAALAVGGLGVGTASAATVDGQATQVAQANWHPRDYCDDWNHRGNRACWRDSWRWDQRNHHWNHYRWDDRGHRWNDRDRDWR